MLKNDSATAHDELYANDVISTEKNMAGGIETIKGLNDIREKSKKFQSMIEEMHSGYANEPKVFGDNIFMEMGMDVNMKEMGRMNMSEMCHYETKDGKIITERFFY